jgi:hypothetical protein
LASWKQQILVSACPSNAAQQSDLFGVYLFPLVLQLELGLGPDRRHMRSPLESL